jgi:hypothetical protein
MATQDAFDPHTFLVASAQGKEAVIAILEAQAFYGEGCLTGQPLRIATAMALTDGVLMRIEKSAMIHVLPHRARLCSAVDGVSAVPQPSDRRGPDRLPL